MAVAVGAAIPLLDGWLRHSRAQKEATRVETRERLEELYAAVEDHRWAQEVVLVRCLTTVVTGSASPVVPKMKGDIRLGRITLLVRLYAPGATNEFEALREEVKALEKTLATIVAKPSLAQASKAKWAGRLKSLGARLDQRCDDLQDAVVESFEDLHIEPKGMLEKLRSRS